MNRAIRLTVVLAIAVSAGCGPELGDAATGSGGSSGAAGGSPGSAGSASVTKPVDRFLPATNALQDFIHGG